MGRRVVVSLQINWGLSMQIRENRTANESNLYRSNKNLSLRSRKNARRTFVFLMQSVAKTAAPPYNNVTGYFPSHSL